MNDDGADWQQQSELEELEQWLAEQKQVFNEIFGANNDGLYDFKKD